MSKTGFQLPRPCNVTRVTSRHCWPSSLAQAVRGYPFTYMTSSSRLSLSLLFNFRSPEVNINGRGQAVLPSALCAEDG